MFRIWLHLSLPDFIKNLFIKKNNSLNLKKIEKFLSKQSNKKFSSIFSQCRVGFLYVLKFLKSKSFKKEIIFCAYNLPEMVNIAHNLGLSVKFCDIDYKTGCININQLKENVSRNTLAIVLTNMFNDPEHSEKIKKIANKLKVTLIEDNAIYFDNFYELNKKKTYSGNFGDYSVFSFNIMKNISSLYGGAVTTNNQDFINYYVKEMKNLKSFDKINLLKQITIFFILKIMSVKILYKYLFVHIIRASHKFKLFYILRIFYPSLQEVKINFPKYYFNKISDLSLRLTWSQLNNKTRRLKIFNTRKLKNEYYTKKLSKIKSNNLNFINIKDYNYQNFLDFPILVKDKHNLNNYLLKKGIEVRFKHYYNCQKLFGSKLHCINAEKFENELICLPNHPKITISYIDFIVNNIELYYSKL